MAEMMEVAGFKVPAATSAKHTLELIELADGLRVQLPIVLINGAKPGPRLYLGAAIHGDEADGVAIASEVVAAVNPEELAGSLVCVTVQNPLAFHADHRIALGHYLKSPLDQAPADPWTCFPGNRNGSFAEALAAKLFELIKTADYAIDMHTPTRGGRYVPITILPPARLGDNAFRAEELGEAFGSGYIIKSEHGMYVRDGILAVEATRAGIPAFTFEIGEGGRLEPEMVTIGTQCVLNAMHFLKMVPGSPVAPCEVIRMSEFVGIRATRGGLLYTERPLGAMVEKGEHLASIMSVYGDELERVHAPASGLFVRTTTLSSVAAGERVATVGLLA